MTPNIPESHNLVANYFAKMRTDLVQTLRSPTLPRNTRRSLARAAGIEWRECVVYDTQPSPKGNRARRRDTMRGGSGIPSYFGKDAVRRDARRRAHATLEKLSKMSTAGWPEGA